MWILYHSFRSTKVQNVDFRNCFFYHRYSLSICVTRPIRFCLWGGFPAGINNIFYPGQAVHMFSPSIRWPMWIGSNVPPIIPIFLRLVSIVLCTPSRITEEWFFSCCLFLHGKERFFFQSPEQPVNVFSLPELLPSDADHPGNFEVHWFWSVHGAASASSTAAVFSGVTEPLPSCMIGSIFIARPFRYALCLLVIVSDLSIYNNQSQIRTYGQYFPLQYLLFPVPPGYRLLSGNAGRKQKPFRIQIGISKHFFNLISPSTTKISRSSGCLSTVNGRFSVNNSSSGKNSCSNTIRSAGTLSRSSDSVEKFFQSLTCYCRNWINLDSLWFKLCLKTVNRFSSPSSKIQSILFAAISWGLAAMSGLYASSSLLILWISSTGSRPSVDAASTIWTRTRVRSMSQEFIPDQLLGCTFDQSRNISNNKATICCIHYTEVRT